MKAMLVDENKRLVWSDVPEPVTNDDSIIIDIEAAALNRADILQKNGKYIRNRFTTAIWLTGSIR